MSNDLTLLSLPLIYVYPDLISPAMSSHVIRSIERENTGQLQASSTPLSAVGIFLLIKSQSEAFSGYFQWRKHTASC